MKKKKRIVVASVIVGFATILFIGFIASTLTRSTMTYTQGTIKIGEEYVTVDIQNWEDLDGGVVRILTNTGEVYKTNYMNVVMVNGN